MGPQIRVFEQEDAYKNAGLGKFLVGDSLQPAYDPGHLTQFQQDSQEDHMTRQCAWCATYLDFVHSGTCVTHGICESCAERIRQSIAEELTPPSDGRVMVDALPRPNLAPLISTR